MSRRGRASTLIILIVKLNVYEDIALLWEDVQPMLLDLAGKCRDTIGWHHLISTGYSRHDF